MIWILIGQHSGIIMSSQDDPWCAAAALTNDILIGMPHHLPPLVLGLPIALLVWLITKLNSTARAVADLETQVLRLEIKPHVIGENNLKMEILVKKNEVDNTRNVLGNPYIIKKETKTTLIVRDGETIVISGLTKQRTDRSESGIPWLKNIYGLGWLFKSLGTGESMEEVLIFITPTILPPQGIAAAPPATDKRTDKPVEKAPSGKASVK